MTLFVSCIPTPPATTSDYYSGEDISAIARITRDRLTKKALFEINVEGKWKLYSGLSVDSINFEVPLLQGEGDAAFQLDVPDSVRSYFQLITVDGKGILAERHLPMTGGYNFRDLGGYKTTDGRYVKWGKIFRSDDLVNLTDEDLRYLSSLPLLSIVDFRTEIEMTNAPDRKPASLSTYYPYSLDPGNLSAALDLSTMDFSKGDSIMKAINIELVKTPENVNRYKDYFAVLQDDSQTPLLFHCSAGKDRTGMAAALTLFALGVDEETIMKDYLLSNVYLGDKYAPYIEQNPSLKSLFEVRSSYLQAALTHIKEQYGSVEKYLEKVLEVNVTKLREMYLY